MQNTILYDTDPADIAIEEWINDVTSSGCEGGCWAVFEYRELPAGGFISGELINKKAELQFDAIQLLMEEPVITVH